jgi:hypothetical protein
VRPGQELASVLVEGRRGVRQERLVVARGSGGHGRLAFGREDPDVHPAGVVVAPAQVLRGHDETGCVTQCVA